MLITFIKRKERNMIKDYIKFSLEGMRRRKLRSALTMIGIFIGIAAVISLISLGQGLQTSVSEQFQRIGTDKVLVLSGSGFGPPGGAIERMTEHDADVIRKVRGVAVVAGVIDKQVSVKFNDRVKSLSLHGNPLDREEQALTNEINSIEIENGRNLKKGDKNKVIIGWELANDDALFDKVIRVGDNIFIAGEKFEVVGIVKKIGQRIQDLHINIPLETAQELINTEDEFDFIAVRVDKGFSPEDVAESIKKEMRRDRNLKEGEENFNVQTFESISNTFSNIFSVIQAVIIGIAAISLLVGGIGIMNTMYMSVMERTKEIGIMKAIGAKNSHILQIFLIESGIYGLVGGIIGVLVGIGIAKSVEFIATNFLGSNLFKAYLSLPLILGAIAFSFLIGALSGIAPSYKASKLNPVDALRYE